MNGGGQVDAQAADARLGGGIDGHGEDIGLVQDEVLSPAGVDAVAIQPSQGGHLCAEQPGTVHHPPGREVLVPGGDPEALGGLLDGGDLVVQEKLYPVLVGVLCQSCGVQEGVKDGGLGGFQRTDAPHLGELGPEFLLGQKPQAPAAVLFPLGLQTGQGIQVGLVEGHQEFAGLAVGHIQLLAGGLKTLVSLHAELGHEGAGLVVKTGVDHGGVPPAGPGGHVGLLLHQGDGEVIAGQLPGHSAAHGTAADDKYVKVMVQKEHLLAGFLEKG